MQSNDTMRPYILSETNYGYTKNNRYEVAILPLGATEPHNLHLPYGTDCYEGTIIGEKICEEAHRRGGKVVLLPTIAYGTETNMHRLADRNGIGLPARSLAEWKRFSHFSSFDHFIDVYTMASSCMRS